MKLQCGWREFRMANCGVLKPKIARLGRDMHMQNAYAIRLQIASGCGFTTCAYAFVENYVIYFSRGLSCSTL